MSKLPEKFTALENKWHEWIVEEEADRAKMRVAKPMAELRAFYDDVQPNIREYIDYIGGYDLNNLPEDVKNLWWLLASFIGVAAVIEMYGSVEKIPGVELIGEYRPIGMQNEHPLLR